MATSQIIGIYRCAVFQVTIFAITHQLKLFDQGGVILKEQVIERTDNIPHLVMWECQVEINNYKYYKPADSLIV